MVTTSTPTSSSTPDPCGDDLPSPRPIIKWAGGKTRLLGQLEKRFPVEFNGYYEPFCGGAALYFSLGSARRPRHPGGVSLGDVNRNLVTMYRAVRDMPERVIDILFEYQDKHGEAFYYSMRATWNDTAIEWSDDARAAMFIYLNKACYNGLWRENKKGEFNVPIGRPSKAGGAPVICDASAIRSASRALAGAKLVADDYVVIAQGALRGDLVYFDPPYLPENEGSFRQYTANGFTVDEHYRLADFATVLARRGVHVILSNADVPLVNQIYRSDFWNVERVQVDRTIGCKNRRPTGEVIITRAR